MPTTTKSKTNFLEWNKNILISSLKKISLNILLIIVLDALFYGLSAFAFIAWYGNLKAKMEGVFLPSTDSLAALGVEKAQQALFAARSFLFFLVFSIILIIVAITFLASIIKGIIWAKTTNTKPTFKLISKFLVLNLIWMGFWFALILLISFLAEIHSAYIYLIVISILGLFFTNTLYTLFMEKPSLSSIFAAIKLNITKIHLFLLPYCGILITFLILVRLVSIIQSIYSPFFIALTAIAYASVVRYYTSSLVLEAALKKS